MWGSKRNPSRQSSVVSRLQILLDQQPGSCSSVLWHKLTALVWGQTPREFILSEVEGSGGAGCAILSVWRSHFYVRNMVITSSSTPTVIPSEARRSRR